MAPTKKDNLLPAARLWSDEAGNWSLNAGAVMHDNRLNRRQTIRVGSGVAFAQVGIVGFNGQIALGALRLVGLPEALNALHHARQQS